jgi:hypothetical protein
VAYRVTVHEAKSAWCGNSVMSFRSPFPLICTRMGSPRVSLHPTVSPARTVAHIGVIGRSHLESLAFGMPVRSEIVRGDWTPLELLFAGAQGLPAAIRALLYQWATGRDTGMCSFPATARQPAQSAFPDVTLVESPGSGKLDASVQGAAVSAERAEPT